MQSELFVASFIGLFAGLIGFLVQAFRTMLAMFRTGRRIDPLRARWYTRAGLGFFTAPFCPDLLTAEGQAHRRKFWRNAAFALFWFAVMAVSSQIYKTNAPWF